MDDIVVVSKAIAAIGTKILTPCSGNKELALKRIAHE